MTREEAIKTLKENCCTMCAYGSQDMDSCDIRICDNKDAIKALEQEPALDKIRAEIEVSTEKWWYGVNNDCFMKLSDVFEIINKYKSESEEEK